MVHNFESWRKAKMQTRMGCGVAHFFRIQDTTYFAVSEILKFFIRRRVERQQHRFTLRLDDEQIDTFFQFIADCQFGYLHPRSTSGHILMKNEVSAKPNT